MNDNKTVRTATQKEQDDINLQYLELEIKGARLNLRELEIQYQELQGKLEAQKIMEADPPPPASILLATGLFGYNPPLTNPDAVEKLYTTVTERLVSLSERCSG